MVKALARRRSHLVAQSRHGFVSFKTIQRSERSKTIGFTASPVIGGFNSGKGRSTVIKTGKGTLSAVYVALLLLLLLTNKKCWQDKTSSPRKQTFRPQRNFELR